MQSSGHFPLQFSCVNNCCQIWYTGQKTCLENFRDLQKEIRVRLSPQPFQSSQKSQVFSNSCRICVHKIVEKRHCSPLERVAHDLSLVFGVMVSQIKFACSKFQREFGWKKCGNWEERSPDSCLHGAIVYKSTEKMFQRGRGPGLFSETRTKER